VNLRGNRAALVVTSAAILAAAATLAVVAIRGPATPAGLQERVRAVGATLRCPVCQDLSVADSPSSVAQDMRAEIARELQAGETPGQIRAGFVSAYGQWILLSPPRRGIGLVAWGVPLLLVLGGLAIAVGAIRRWSVAGSRARADEGAGATAGSPHAAFDPLPAADRRLLDHALRSTEDEPE
jgi:cytochrome c-type biogenesis protein CcmH